MSSLLCSLQCNQDDSEDSETDGEEEDGSQSSTTLQPVSKFQRYKHNKVQCPKACVVQSTKNKVKNRESSFYTIPEWKKTTGEKYIEAVRCETPGGNSGTQTVNMFMCAASIL